MLAQAGDDPESPIPVAIETSCVLMVAAVGETGRRVYAINPMAVARYSERHSVFRKKSDHLDAKTLANILRTDAHMHPSLPTDGRTGAARSRSSPARPKTRSGNAPRPPRNCGHYCEFRRRPGARGFRRRGTCHPRLRAQHLHRAPHGEEQSPRRGRLRLGLRRHPQTRAREDSLRPPTHHRRPPRRSPAQYQDVRRQPGSWASSGACSSRYHAANAGRSVVRCTTVSRYGAGTALMATAETCA